MKNIIKSSKLTELNRIVENFDYQVILIDEQE